MSMDLPLAAALPRRATCLAASWPQCSSMQRRIPSYSSSRFLVMRRLSVQSNSSCWKLQDRRQPGAREAAALASASNIKESSSTRDDTRHDHEQAGRNRLMSKHPLPPEKQEIFRSLDEWAEENLLPFLKPVEKCWQPQDFLPVPRSMSPASSEEFVHDVREIQERAAGLPDELYVCLVGNMITEEALPTYQSLLNTFHGVNDVSGASPTAWARWIRAWSAEENRHGDLLNKYLYLTGRLDMRQVEKTVQYLIGSGMDIGGDNNAFCGIIYGCFQERATFISHGNTAGHAKQHGDAMLAKICGLVAADEKRHAAAYTTLMSKLFEVDPDESVRALAHMMRIRVTMPAQLMFDGCDSDLFRHFSAVGQCIGVYTAWDYGDMLDFFLREWEVESMAAGLSPEGRRAQDYVCGLPGVIRKMAERSAAHDQKKESRYLPFSWIFNKRVLL